MTTMFLVWWRVWIAAGLAAVMIGAVLVVDGGPWVGDSLWGQEVIGRSQLLVLPLVSGFGAHWGRTDGRGLWAILGSERMRRRHLFNVAFCQSVALLTTYAVMHVTVLTVSRSADLHFRNASIWPFLTHVAAGVLSTAVTKSPLVAM